jgi:hypothetical protein
LTRQGPFCADLARENDEPLAATASRIDHWFLIEYRGLWTRDALPGSGLSDQVKAHIREQLASVRHGRLLFIRRPDRRKQPELVVFSACSVPGEERITRLAVEGYEDLRGLDLRGGEPCEHPLFLVCTHGKHDPCCARYGRPLYEALRDELDEDWVWQSSHIGGDRFAGNLVCLPHGLYYGRVDRETAGVVLDEHLAGRVLLGHYRGRSHHPFHVQAAERWAREQAGATGIDDVTIQSVEQMAGGWRVAVAAGGRTYLARVEPQAGDLTILTCSSETAQRPRRYAVTAS